MMKKNTLTRVLGVAALCCASSSASLAQSLDKTPAPRDLYREGKALFVQKAYAASLSPLQAYLRQAADEPRPAHASGRPHHAEYMLACAPNAPRWSTAPRNILRATTVQAPHRYS